MERPLKSEDFERLYDLADPRPYFRGLEPSGYRMPETLAGLLIDLAPKLREARGRSEYATLRLLDFACGYGAVGMFLQNDISMNDLYGYYGGEGRVEEDAAFFSAHRRKDQPYAVGGLDIAGNAVRYALNVHAAKVGFTENVLESKPSVGLSIFLGGTDLIVESGAVGDLLAPGFEVLLDEAGDAKPWVVYCPRPNVDTEAPAAVLRKRGYVVDPLGEPVPYRKPLSRGEYAAVLEGGRAHGLSDTEIFDAEGFMLVQVRLARPETQSGAL